MIYFKLQAYISLFDIDPDHPHNLINCSMYHCQAILKISSESVKNFVSNVGNRQTNRQTDRKTNAGNLGIGTGNNS